MDNGEISFIDLIKSCWAKKLSVDEALEECEQKGYKNMNKAIVEQLYTTYTLLKERDFGR